MHIETIPIGSINPAPYNPRKDLRPGDPEYERIRASLDQFDLVEPLVWNRRSGNLVGGHQRLKVLLERGDKEVVASVVDLPPEQERLLNLALNKVSGVWDEEKLAALLDELVRTPDLDIAVSGFDLPDANTLLAGILHPPEGEREETFDLERELAANRPEVTRRGDLILLGCVPARQHRLLCGDSTDRSDVKRLMDGERAILFATDPPYLVDYDGTNHPAQAKQRRRKNKDWSGSYGITWDDADASPFLYEDFIRTAIDEAIRPSAAWYCWHASRRQAMVERAWNRYGAFVHQQIIWLKDRPILNRSWFSWQHEPCYFGWMRPHKPPRRSQVHVSSVWQVRTVLPGSRTDHPTSKPPILFAIPMRQHTRPGEICYEPFAGSGSQVIAAEQLGRRCFALEISPRYCDLVVRRFIAYAGEDAVEPEVAERYRLPEVSRGRHEAR